LEKRLQEYDNTLYVYKDFVDGANHYTQKAWMGSSNDNIPTMAEDAQGYDGISGIVCELDLTQHSWGGYMFINGILPAGETQPLASFGEVDAGLDLSGATALSFCAKGSTGGESVEFFMGGLGHSAENFNLRSLSGQAPYADSTAKISLGYVTLTKEWQRFEIPLAGADLSRIGCGFGWVTNDINNGVVVGATGGQPSGIATSDPAITAVRFSLDNIRYEFEPSASAPAYKPRFLQSYASATPGTDDAVINNFAYLYDQCAAAMALTYAKKPERACQIADAIVYALENDRYYSDGRLRNAYKSGDIKSFPGWLSARGKEFAQMPGFYDTKDGAWREDLYAASAGSTGNMAWAILALCEVYEGAVANPQYLDCARKLGEFILTLKAKNGFTGGYEGWEEGEVRATYSSTEHNTDLITAFGRLHKLTGDSRYAEAADHATTFVLSMYDSEKGCFYTGTTTDGTTINKEAIPLDCQTWTLLALGDEFTDGAKVIDYLETNMAVDDGYDFNTDKDGVWYEGTAQVALLYLAQGNEAKYREILDNITKATLEDGSVPAADKDGLSTGFKVSGMDIDWEYDRRSHVGATAWLAFAQMGKNPFAY
jgi:hypothetical protein